MLILRTLRAALRRRAGGPVSRPQARPSRRPALETLEARVLPDATGFWHVEQPAGSSRTWFDSPSGERTFLLGVNSVAQVEGSTTPGIQSYLRRTDPTSSANLEWARLSSGNSNGYTAADTPFYFNSVGAFSTNNYFDNTGGDSYVIRPTTAGGAGAPYNLILYPQLGGSDRALKNASGTALVAGLSGHMVGDPWNPAFLADLDNLVATKVVPRRNDPDLQMWYLGNEEGMFDVAGHGGQVRDFRDWLWTTAPSGSSIDNPLCARDALGAFLRAEYGTIAALNSAWGSNYASFTTLVRNGPFPVPYVHDANAAARDDLERFVHDDLLTKWVNEVTTRVRAADPNHIIATPRFAIEGSSSYHFWTTADTYADSGQSVGGASYYSPLDLLGRHGNAGFDVIALNDYTGASTFPTPWYSDGLTRLNSQSGLPVVISEFGIRARISGWSNQGGAQSLVNTQADRAADYVSQMNQFTSFPFVVGAFWHRWADDYNPNSTATQINMGIVQVNDSARGFVAGTVWSQLDQAIGAYNATIYTRLGVSGHVYDPGFELPALGTGAAAYAYDPSGSPWSFGGPAGVAGNGSALTAANPNAPDGTQVAFLEYTGGISQAVAFTAGYYTVSFEAAQRAGNATAQTFQVLIDGSPAGVFAPGGTGYAAYNSNSFAVTAGTHTVSFVGLDPDGQDNTALLDHVQINHVIAGYGFEAPYVGGGYQYDPAGTPLTYTGHAGVAGDGSALGNPTAPQGSQIGFLQDTGGFGATGNLAAGTYSLTFLAAQSGANLTNEEFQVLVDGVVVGDFTPAGTGYSAYTTATFTVPTGGLSHTVQFVGLGGDTVFLDQLQLLALS